MFVTDVKSLVVLPWVRHKGRCPPALSYAAKQRHLTVLCSLVFAAVGLGDVALP